MVWPSKSSVPTPIISAFMCLSLYQIVPEDLCINDNEYCHLALGIIENEIVLYTKSVRILRREAS